MLRSGDRVPPGNPNNDYMADSTRRVWGRPLGYVTLWDPKEHFSEENSSPGGLGATPHYAYSHAVPT